jgi:hypothetical protein
MTEQALGSRGRYTYSAPPGLSPAWRLARERNAGLRGSTAIGVRRVSTMIRHLLCASGGGRAGADLDEVEHVLPDALWGHGEAG